MKKIFKKISLISIILCMSLLFIDNVQAETLNKNKSFKHCSDFSKKECTGATADNGDKCITVKKEDGKYECVPKNCSAYSDLYAYNNIIEENGIVLTDCKNDTRCVQKGNLCLPKDKTQLYTCEDMGVEIDRGETNCTRDAYENECDPLPDTNNDFKKTGYDRKICTFKEGSKKFYEIKGNFVCTDLTTEKACNANKQDSLLNVCAWDPSKPKGKKCTIITYQDDLNKAADAAKANGTPVEDAVEAESKKQKEEMIAKIAEIIKNKNNTKIVESNVKFKCSDVKYLTSAWLLIRIAAPFIIVLFGSLDFIKAVAAGDEKKMKESKTNFIKRLIAFLLLILLPFVVQLIFTFMGTYGSNNICLLKCITTNDTSEKGCD